MKVNYWISLIALIAMLSSCGSKSNTKSEMVQEKSIQKKGAQEMAVFFQAALDGNIPIVEKFLSEGTDVNSIDENKRTALMLASFNGHTSVVKVLLAKGADVKMVDEVNRTALMFASTGPFNDTVIELIKAGSDINAQDGHENWTPLMFAAGEGQLEVVKTLIANAADKKIVDIDGESALDFARTKGHKQVVEYLDVLDRT